MKTQSMQYTNFEAITFLEIHINNYVIKNMIESAKIPENDVSKREWNDIRNAIDWSDCNTKHFMRDFIKNLFSQNIDFLALFTEYKELLWVMFPNIPKDFSNSLQTNKFHISSVMLHSLIAMSHYKGDDWLVRVACLLHDIGKIEAKTIDDNGICHFYNHPHMSAEMFRTLFSGSIFTNEERLILYAAFEHHDDSIPERTGTMLRLSKKIQRTLENNASSFDISFENSFIVDYVIWAIDLWVLLKKCDVLGHSLMTSKNLMDKIYRLDSIYSAAKPIIFEKTVTDSIKVTGGDLITYASLPCNFKISQLLNELATLCYNAYKTSGKTFSRDELLDIITNSQVDRAQLYAKYKKASAVLIEKDKKFFIQVADKRFNCPPEIFRSKKVGEILFRY